MVVLMKSDTASEIRVRAVRPTVVLRKALFTRTGLSPISAIKLRIKNLVSGPVLENPDNHTGTEEVEERDRTQASATLPPVDWHEFLRCPVASPFEAVTVTLAEWSNSSNQAKPRSCRAAITAPSMPKITPELTQLYTEDRQTPFKLSWLGEQTAIEATEDEVNLLCHQIQSS